jgi:hypothetical protein
MPDACDLLANRYAQEGLEVKMEKMPNDKDGEFWETNACARQ